MNTRIIIHKLREPKREIHHGDKKETRKHFGG